MNFLPTQLSIQNLKCVSPLRDSSANIIHQMPMTFCAQVAENGLTTGAEPLCAKEAMLVPANSMKAASATPNLRSMTRSCCIASVYHADCVHTRACQRSWPSNRFLKTGCDKLDGHLTNSFPVRY